MPRATRRFQFSLRQMLLAILFAAVSCGLFPMALDLLTRTRSVAGPVLLIVASAFAGAAAGAFFSRAGTMAIIGAALAVAFMAATVVIFGTC